MATEVAFSDLSTWLGNQPDNTASTPYELNITGLTVNNISTSRERGTLGYILKQNNTKYVDLSLTTLPFNSYQSTSMHETFMGCESLVKSPAIPNGIVTLYNTFAACTSLKNAPEIPNSVTTISGAFIRCTSLVNAPIIPSSVTNMYQAFSNCTSLVNAPIIPSSVTNMAEAFYECTSIEYKPVIPSSVTSSSNCYFRVLTTNWKGTRSQADLCPNDCEYQLYNDDRVTLEDTIYNIDISNRSTASDFISNLDPNTPETAYKIYLRGLTSSNAENITIVFGYIYIQTPNKFYDFGYTTIPQGTSLTNLFWRSDGYYMYSCSSMVTAPVLPTDQTSMTRTFSYCFALKNVTIPNGITDLSGTFGDCASLTEIAIIPSSVTSAKEAFKNCTSLQKIDEFHIPLNTLKNNPDFQDMFAGCTSLTQIGFKIDTDTWHAWRLKFDANSVEGKIFGFNNGQLTSTAVLNTQISKNDIRLPVLTDELWFPPANMSDSDVEDVIRSVLNNRYTYWNKAVIDPNSKSLVMMASDPNNVVSNFLNGGGGGGVEKLVISTTRSVNVTKDTRIFADGSAITITLNYGSSAEGYVAEVYAIQACTITYYTAQGTTTSLAMEAGGKAIFVYFSGWKLHSNYGTTNSVTVDNMQSVSSNAVYKSLVIKSDTSSSNTRWFLQESSNGIIIGYGWNVSQVNLNQGSFFLGEPPAGYKVVDIISADAFASRNTNQVMGAVHIYGNGQGVVVYIQTTGTFYAGYIRFMAVLQKI